MKIFPPFMISLPETMILLPAAQPMFPRLMLHRTKPRGPFMRSMVDEKNRFNPNIQIAAIASRRSFLKTAVAAAVLGSATPGVLLAQQKEEAVSRRPLGRTGEKVSAIGLGGYHIGKLADEKESIAIIRSAIDRGIT